jgi:phospholipid/cholesterol/gamma-HCH transport system permease protein
MLSTRIRQPLETLGRNTIRSIEEVGYAVSVFVESLYWLVRGHHRRQKVSLAAIAHEASNIGIYAIPISAILCFAVGIMLAIQGIETLKTFGAESQVIIGIALSTTREFAPLIVSILVAGRSGSAITARIGTMNESQEIDALRVMGVEPVRFLATPIIIAMLISLPCLTILGDFMGLLGGAVYSAAELQITIGLYFEQSLEVLSTEDLFQGLIKSLVFALIIALVSISNGFQASGGSVGVGKATTRSVVMSISLIIIADMVFTYFMNR